jgi:alpha-galactosidase
MSSEIKRILTNRELIAVNQDSLGKQGFKIYDEGNFEIWQKPLLGGAIALCLLNLEIRDKEYIIDWSKIKIKDFSGGYQATNLWENRPVGDTDKLYSVKIPARDVIIFKLEPCNRD